MTERHDEHDDHGLPAGGGVHEVDGSDDASTAAQTAVDSGMDDGRAIDTLDDHRSGAVIDEDADGDAFTGTAIVGGGSSAGSEPAAVGAVRAAEARLRGLDAAGTPAATHVATYDEVHGVLQDALADLDER